MSLKFFSGLQSRLIVLVIFAVFPALLLALMSDLEQRQHATVEIEQNIFRLVRFASNQYSHVVEHTRELLTTLSHVPAVKNLDPRDCDSFLHGLNQIYPRYSGFSLAKPDGTVFCSSFSPAKPINFSGRPWYSELIQTRDFVIGEYQLGRMSGNLVSVCAYPITDNGDRLKAILTVGIDLSWLSEFIKGAQLPPEASVTLVDQSGRILSRYPQSGRWIGEDIRRISGFKEMLSRQGEGKIKAKDLDGVPKIFAFRYLGNSAGKEGPLLCLGMSGEVAFAEAKRDLARNLILLSIAAAVALAAALYFGNIFVRWPVNELLATMEKVKMGDLEARTRLSNSEGELGRLAHAFNEMTDSLQRREAERKQAAEVLRRSEAQYRTLFENVFDVVFSIDREFKIFSLSPSVERALGYKPDELIGRPLSELNIFTPEHLETAISDLKRVFDGNSLELSSYELIARDGSIRFGEISATPLTEAGKVVGVTAVARDVTEKKKLETQLLQAQKMEAVGRLAGGIAHDFNNLMSAVIGFSELALDQLRKDDPMRDQLEEIFKAGKRATILTRQLLAFSRKQVMKPYVLDLNNVVADTEKMLHRLIGEDIELETILAPDLGRVKADPGQIEQVIMNLAVNARDAMPTGGKLTIMTQNVFLDESYARQHGVELQPGSYVMLAVSDSGVGMNKEVLSKIFEPFYTTKEKDKGTGLGLATVYGVVKQSGGYIWVYSEPAQGATFKIYLPMVEEETELVQKEQTEKKELTGSETILAVEDDDPLRNLVRTTLNKYGYNVLDAPGGKAALEISRRHKGCIHLLLTDVVMPDISGRQLADQITAEQPELKVLYMSGYADNIISHHGILERDINFIEKPFTPKSLAQAVRGILDEVKWQS